MVSIFIHWKVVLLIISRFLGPRMIYTSGVILNPDIEESLEQLQDNKLAVVCSKLDIKPTDKSVFDQTVVSS